MHETIHHGINVINLGSDTCPTKEDRVGSVNAYTGRISQLVKEGKKEGHFVQLHRKFQQTAQCMMTQTTGRLISVRESVLVIHGAIGCGAAGISGYRQIYKNIPPELGKPPNFELAGLSTNLNERDIVYGGAEKLKKTIIEAERRYAPKAIFIVTSCASGVMGDDIEGAVEAVKDTVKATLVPIHCEAFKTGISQTAFDSMAHAVVKYLVKEPEKTQEDLVAVPAPFSITWSDRLEIERLLGKMGLRTLLIPDFATVTELEKLSEVALVAPTCPSYGDYWQLALHEKFDIPYFRHPAPLGIKNTETWLRTIGEYTGKEKEAEKLIEEELAVVLPEIEKLKKEFKGKNGRIIVSAGLARAVFIPRLAADLGMDVSAVNTLELDPYILDELKSVYDEIGDFEIHASNVQSFEQSHMLKRLNPELYTGCPFMGLYKREASNVRNHSFRHDYSPPSLQIGFRGLLTYGYVMQRAFNNPSLCKTLHRTQPQPYKQWWHKQPDILYYTRENAVYGDGGQATVIPPEISQEIHATPDVHIPEQPIADPGGLMANGYRIG